MGVRALNSLEINLTAYPGHCTEKKKQTQLAHGGADPSTREVPPLLEYENAV